jgi:hypothetical protein
MSRLRHGWTELSDVEGAAEWGGGRKEVIEEVAITKVQSEGNPNKPHNPTTLTTLITLITPQPMITPQP